MFKDGCMIFKELIKTMGLLLVGGLVIGFLKIYQLVLHLLTKSRKVLHCNIFPAARRIVMVQRGISNIKGILGFSWLRLGWMMFRKELVKKPFPFQHL